MFLFFCFPSEPLISARVTTLLFLFNLISPCIYAQGPATFRRRAGHAGVSLYSRCGTVNAYRVRISREALK